MMIFQVGIEVLFQSQVIACILQAHDLHASEAVSRSAADSEGRRGDGVQNVLHILVILRFREEFHLEDESGAFIHNLFVELAMVCACTLFRDSYMLADWQYLKGLEILILLYVLKSVHGLLVAA